MEANETGFFEVFHEVGRAVLSVLDVHEVTHLISKRMVPALGLKASALLLAVPEGGNLSVAASHLLSHEFLAAEPLKPDPGISEALEGRPHQMADAFQESPSANRDLIQAEGIASILSIPMSLRGEVIGVLRLYTGSPRAFSEDEVEVISALADMGALAIENARLFEEKGEALSRLLQKGGVDYDVPPPTGKYRVRAVDHGAIPSGRSYAYFNRLHRLAGTVAARMEGDRVLEAAAKEIAEAVDVKGCSLLWLNFETQELELLATCGLSRSYLDKGALQMDRSLPKVMEGETVFVPDAGKDERLQYPEAAGREGIVSILSVPIFVMEKVRGVLRLYTSDQRTFPPDEIEFVKALAEMGGIAILNAKLYETRDNDYAFWEATLQYLGIRNPEDNKPA